MNFWGKSKSDGAYHHLVCHCLDVAAVADLLLESDDVLRKCIRDASPVNEKTTLILLRFFACIHDLGKFSLPFQNKAPILARQLNIPEWNYSEDTRLTHHSRLGRGIWKTFARNIARHLSLEDESVLDPLAEAAFGHHGLPVLGPNNIQRYFRGTREEACRFVNDAAALFFMEAALGTFEETAQTPLSSLAAGLFVLADWIASNGDWFQAHPEPPRLDDYWLTARTQAGSALDKSGLLPTKPSNLKKFHEFFPNLPDDAQPTPLQSLVLDLPETGFPELLILEDLTGSGKTEAAILAAHRHMRSGSSSGLYFGLPTMATANAMYDRLGGIYRRLFADDDASLVLAHGGRALNEDYLASIGLEKIRATGNGEEDGAASTPTCSAWLADNRKKALLAPCGAGSLDQALLAVLPSKHQCLRLLGLCRSTLIVDEVHSYDQYTGCLAGVLLTFHAAFGGSAILLSATMTRNLRESLVEAWRRGRALAGVSIPEASLKETAFPLVTRLTSDGLEEIPFSTTRELDVAVIPVSDEEEMFQTLRQAHTAGACACWIRNTVGDAVAARRRLVQDYGVPEADALLFHARYAGCNRNDIESRTMEFFGRKSTPDQRRGKILLATQVVEQSLDLDFDLLLSDLAPMELMIQRAGRCHRHEWRTERPGGYTSPRMLALMPEPAADADGPWYSRLFPAGQYVYPRPAVLWRTARLLWKKRRIFLPDHARELVEGAYAGDAPEELLDLEEKAAGTRAGDAAFAQYVCLRFEAGYCLESSDSSWDLDLRTPTRLGEETRQLRLVRVRDGAMSLWGANHPGDFSMRACLRSEVRVLSRKLAEALVPKHLEAPLAEFAERLPDKGRWCSLLPLEEDGAGAWRGQGLDSRKNIIQVRYGAEGLELLQSES